MKTTTYLLLLTLAMLPVISKAQYNPGLADTPPMGWNSWNWFGKQQINEEVVREVIDAMAEEGLAEAGYNYVVVDGGWRDVKLGPEGELLAHPEKFPHGIKALADYAHLKGLKFGLHVVPGTHDCGGDPVGAWGKEEVHLKQFVDWGLDLIKMDQCRMTEDPCVACPQKGLGWSEAAAKKSYIMWSELLEDCGRDILYSISAYQYRDWYPGMCHMARTTGDIQALCNGGAIFNPPDSIKRNFFSVIEIALSNNVSAVDAGNGYWNDPDMLVTGEQGMSKVEQESHFGLWCIMSSPLLLGNDPRQMTDFEKGLITNPELIAINQDPSGQGSLIRSDENSQIWAKNLQDGSVAVLLLNLDISGEKEVGIDISDLGLNGEMKARDALRRKDVRAVNKSLSRKLDTNESAVILLSK